MVPLTSLLAPIVVSAVVVFFASFTIHMVLGYHKSDLRKLPDQQEDEILATIAVASGPGGVNMELLEFGPASLHRKVIDAWKESEK